MRPGKCSGHFCDSFAVRKYCRSEYTKIISLVIPYSTINSCRPDNQKLPSKLAPALVGVGEPLTVGLVQGASIRCITVVISLSMDIVFVCCVVRYLGLDEAVSPVQFVPNCIGLSRCLVTEAQG